MNATVDYLSNTASVAEIAAHLACCDTRFVPPLSGRTEIPAYAVKIAGHANRYEAWAGDCLVGLVAAYGNDPLQRMAYVTSVSVLSAWAGQGIAATLLARCLEHAKALGLRGVQLEVAADNAAAIRLYRKHGFEDGDTHPPVIHMHLYFNNRQHYESQTQLQRRDR